MVSDVDGTIDSIKITSFPTGANYLKIGTTYYTNPVGGQCPPQATCTTWPGSVTLPYADVSSIAVDPTSNGNTTVTIPFTAKDNGLGISNSGISSSVTLNISVPASLLTASGNVWNDADGDGTKNGSEAFTNAAGTGETLYAVLVQSTNTYSGDSTILTAVPVAANGAYSFPNVPGGNSYEVRIVSSASAPQDGANLSTITPKLAPQFTGGSTNNNGTITSYTDGTSNPRIILGIVNASKSSLDFGIEQRPTSDSKSFTAANSAFTKSTSITIGGNPTYAINGNSSSLTGSTLKSLSGNDPEDCASASSCAVGKKFKITAINANTLVYYDYGSGPTLVNANTSISNFDPANMTIYGQQGQGGTSVAAIGFDYTLVDNAGQVSSSATYRIQSNAPLPIMISNFKATLDACKATLSWNANPGNHISNFEIQQSTNGRWFELVGIVAAHQELGHAAYSYQAARLHATNYFRLKQVDVDGSEFFSNTLVLSAGNCETSMVTASPNPVTSTLQVQGLPQGSATIILYNAVGLKVATFPSLSNSASLNVTGLASGVYQLRVVDANGTLLYTKTLLKQ